jgi:hypothetical protein
VKNLTITKQWLEEQGACSEGQAWFLSQRARGLKTVVNNLIKARHLDWANWTVVRFMDQKQQVRYACYAAQTALKNFEEVYPQDNRPRLAIEAALKWVESPTGENRESAAWSAARAAAWSAWASAGASAGAAEAAAWSAWAAARAAEAADSADSADSAESAARLAARSAEEAGAADSAVLKNIVLYGLNLVLTKNADNN